MTQSKVEQWREIPLTKGRVAIVDAEDFDLVNAHIWYAATSHRACYARTRSRVNGRWVCVSMHRFILGVTDRAIQVDHKNHNGLDNRRCNLRLCDNRTNQANARIRSNNNSGLKGVFFEKERGCWRVQITEHKRNRYLGRFDNLRDAAAAYDAAAVRVFGEFALTNKHLAEKGHAE